MNDYNAPLSFDIELTRAHTHCITPSNIIFGQIHLPPQIFRIDLEELSNEDESFPGSWSFILAEKKRSGKGKTTQIVHFHPIHIDEFRKFDREATQFFHVHTY